MKKSFKKIISMLFAGAFLLAGLGITPEPVKAAGTPSNMTMATATPIEIGGSASCTFSRNSHDEAHYFKFTVPKNIGNRWITVAVQNNASWGITVSLQDSSGEILSSKYLEEQHVASFTTRTQGADTRMDEPVMLVPGNTYYIMTASSYWAQGNVTASVGSVRDDNWGTYAAAASMTVGQWKNGKIEKGDDIDCFSVVLPKDNRKHAFNITSDKNIKVSFSNGNRVLLSEVLVDANKTNSTYKATGKGQRIYIRVQVGNDNVQVANYSIKVSTQKKNISKLSLSKYKKRSKKIVGITIANATVKVRVNKKTYTVKSNKKGKFTVKLKKKLKSKNKIKVSVSKKQYATKTKTFKVK